MSASRQSQAALAPGQGHVRVKPSGPIYTDQVLADLGRISECPAGRALFQRVRDAGWTMTIEQPNPPTDPPNAWAMPRDALGTEVVIAFDPANWPSPVRPGCPPSDAVLFGRLEDAVAMAVSEHDFVSAVEVYLRERDGGLEEMRQ